MYPPKNPKPEILKCKFQLPNRIHMTLMSKAFGFPQLWVFGVKSLTLRWGPATPCRFMVYPQADFVLGCKASGLQGFSVVLAPRGSTEKMKLCSTCFFSMTLSILKAQKHAKTLNHLKHIHPILNNLAFTMSEFQLRTSGTCSCRWPSSLLQLSGLDSS